MTIMRGIHDIQKIELGEVRPIVGHTCFARDLVVTHGTFDERVDVWKMELYAESPEALEVAFSMEEFKDACDELEWVKAELGEAQAEIRRLNERLESLGVVEI